MRPAAPLLVLALAACGDVGSAERLSSRETLDGIDVPTIGTVGDFPDPAHRTVVNVTADGRVVIDGATIPRTRLDDELTRRGARTPGVVVEGTKPPVRLSDEVVVLRVDGALPWGSAQRLVQACAEARILRFAFAVRCAADRIEGALVFEFPMDKGCDGPQGLSWKDVEIAPGRGGSPGLLFAALTQFPSSETAKLATSLDVDPRLPTRVALELIDAAIRVGSVSVELAAIEPPHRGASPEDFAQEVARLRLPTADYALRLGGKKIADPTGARPFDPVARVRGRVAVPALNFKKHETDELGDPIPPAKPPK